MTAITALTACNRSQNNATQAAPTPQVSVLKLHPQPVAVTAELPGRIVAFLEAEVRPQVGGIIQQRLFTEGGEVKAGQPLYQIDPASYRAARDSAEAALQRAQAAIPSAQAKADRNQTLIKQNAISRQDYEEAIDALAQARANVASAKASLDTARIDLDRTTIRAPISGRIDRSTLTPGALVSASQSTALTTIHQIDRVNIDLTQSSANLLNLREAVDPGRIVTTNGSVPVKLKLENGSTYAPEGRLEFGESSVASGTGTYTLRATVPNPRRLLLPGMYVRAIVEEGTVPQAYLLPQRAVSRNTRGEATALLVRSGKVEEVELANAREHGNDWLVTQGLHDGDALIVEGTQQARVGDTVAATEVILDAATGKVRALPAAKPNSAAADAKDPAKTTQQRS
ncbi:membrane fusion protein (multidrug efflux system) [Paraburkholderia bannensis]|uniref:Membrane fusion protein (Multidrug efflux system) n=1 Tax=Paraburkholderia bannensis TaxID=765414 RepID=A0A7W9TXM8_9BURK|nr:MULTISPECIES: efflux RND transporter periplasmic adaptor subunit [Paraburkholderia]MBB3258270.1 membrane fusion protein (multidrug efflux system) [Paraburkholderia sp. WP4_3_2]MBB6103283.1 membrane fusion protein (multidrug efflux system) [Paraburkholderia bannensis]